MDKEPTTEEIKEAQKLARSVSPLLLGLLEADADNLQQKETPLRD